MKQSFAIGILVVSVTVLPGCGQWLKDKLGMGGKDEPSSAQGVVGGGDVLVSIKGKAVVTAQSFENEFDQLLNENPQLKSILPMMPDAKKNFLMGMVNQEVVDFWVAENKVNEKQDYKKEYDRMMHQVKRMLNTKYFGQEHPVQVGDAELQEYYEKNKDTMPDLLISRGGVKVVGVSFDKEDDAKAFLAKVNATKGDVKKAADDAKFSKNFRDFKIVNKQSVGIDAALRDKVVELKKVPTTELVKVGDKSFWVVRATEKEEVKYRPFDQVKPGLEQYVAREKRMEAFEKQINKLKQEYNVVVNEAGLAAKEEKEKLAADTKDESANLVPSAKESAEVIVAENDDVAKQEATPNEPAITQPVTESKVA